MVWFRVDDGFSRHRKVKALRKFGARVFADAITIWTLCGADCAYAIGQGGVRDGFVSTDDLAEVALPLTPGAKKAAAAALVEVGLWVSVEGGWEFHDWTDRQPTSEKIQAQRESWKTKKSQIRSGKDHVSQGDSPVDSPRDSKRDSTQDSPMESPGESLVRADTHARVRTRGPVPTRPDPDLRQHGDLDQVAREPASLAAPVPSSEPTTGLGHLVRGFQSRWQAKNRDMWPGFGKHRGRADEIGLEVERRPDGPAWLASCLDGYFASTEPFVTKVRHNFAVFASDPGRWAPPSARTSTPSAREYHPGTHGDLGKLGGMYQAKWNLWCECARDATRYAEEVARRAKGPTS